MFSTTADLDKIIPNAGLNFLFKTATYAADYDALARFAELDIKNQIKKGTSPDPTDDDVLESLAEIEALFVAHRRWTAVYATKSQEEGGGAFRSDFLARGKALLNDLQFPASATTPVKAPAFVGSHDLSVEVFDGFTAASLWRVVCTAGGDDSSAIFSVWNRKTDGSAVWNVAAHPAWPARQASDDPRGMSFQVRLTITSSAATDFVIGDAWSFRTWGTWKRKGMARRRIRMVGPNRGGGGQR